MRSNKHMRESLVGEALRNDLQYLYQQAVERGQSVHADLAARQIVIGREMIQRFYASRIRLSAVRLMPTPTNGRLMPLRGAIEAMQEQLVYWKREREVAREVGDTERIAECEKFIERCERGARRSELEGGTGPREAATRPAADARRP